MAENYLSSIRLSNFQSLANAEVEFSPGLTALCGPSNLGKSATLRAIRALAKNAPSTGLVRKGASKFVATATFYDGTVETLEKGAKVSTFTIERPGQEPIINAKSGVKAPEDIEQLWHVAEPDGKPLWYATQHDAPFLLAEPASAVAKVLGDLTNASMLMEAVQRANKLRTESLNDAKARHREAEEATDELSRYADLEAREARLGIAKDAYSLARQAQDKCDKLVSLKQAYTVATKALTVIDAKIVTVSDTSELLTTAQKCAEKLASVERFITFKAQLEHKLETAHSKIGALTTQHQECETKIHELMDAAGQCPLCGRGL